jgi:hypothetical protein
MSPLLSHPISKYHGRQCPPSMGREQRGFWEEEVRTDAGEMVALAKNKVFVKCTTEG